MLLAIGAAVFFLFNDSSEQKSLSPKYGLLAAVPVDAAAVMHFDSFEKAVATLDSESALSPFLAELSNNRAIEKRLRSARAVVSWHYNGKLVPLLSVEDRSDRSDSLANELAALARRNTLSCESFESGGLRLFIISPSLALLQSAQRHIIEGHSLASRQEFVTALSDVRSSSFLLFSREYASTMLPEIKNLAEWVSLGLDAVGEELLLEGGLHCGDSERYFRNVLDASSPVSLRFAELAPASTVYAKSLSLVGEKNYRYAYERYLSSYSALKSYQAELSKYDSELRNRVAALDLKEIALITWAAGKDSNYSAILLRKGRKDKDGEIVKDAFAEYPGVLYGKAFKLDGADSSVNLGEWLAIGSEEALRDLVSRREDSLQAMLKRCGKTDLIPEASAVVYNALNLDSEHFFARDIRPAVAKFASKYSFVPAVASYSKSRGLSLRVVRLSDGPGLSEAGKKAAPEKRRVRLDVPQGPFEVFNFASSKTNRLSQQKNYSLSLKDEKGKAVWTVPFDAPLCGRVANVDYFKNGKIQWIFASGSRLLLLDRLGRFVKSFKLDLGKPVVLGPDVYDFDKNKNYSIVVLFEDNTISLLNLRGKNPEGWKGIAPSGTVLDLPRLVKQSGKRYWVVRTSDGDAVYEFNGGEPIKKKIKFD